MDVPKLPNFRILIGIAAAALVLIIGYAFLVEPQQVSVKYLEIKHPALASLLGDKIVVHLSDLHIKNIGSREKKVLAALDLIKPDVILLTGDYLSWRGDYKPGLDFLSMLHARIGIWGILGDSDKMRSRQSCFFCHEPGSSEKNKRHSVRFLENSYDEVKINNHSIIIGGVDGKVSESMNLLELNKQLKRGLPTLLLAHNPLTFREVPPDAGLVMLAGDTHGGQVLLPSLFWRLAGYEKTAVYPSGVFLKGKNVLSVSSGIGTSHLPLRFLRKPEILVYRFTGSAGAAQ